ncbi:hypothetical protein PENTCL1PPCAC_19433, partial [Pristionchus entomophagus]
FQMPDVARRSRHRRRRDEEEEEEDGSGFGGWKLGLVIGVIVVCFAVVYPHVFHPLLMSLIGRGGSSDPVQAARSDRPPMHPGMAGRGPAGSRGPGPSAHPSIQYAQSQVEGAASKGGARSLYTFMIPIYTVGVIAFLLYTMFKSKKKNRRNRRRGSDDEYSDDEEDEGRGGAGRSRPLGGRKMRDLQDRLKQTESAMSKILEQLEKAQSEGKLTPEMMANLGDQQATKAEKPKASKAKKSAKKEQAPAKADKTLESVAQQLPDEQTTQYMEDLEKALADFKELSDLYEDAQGGRRRRQASESESEGSPATEDLSSEDEDVDDEEDEDEDSKASSAHPFPEEENGQDEEDGEEEENGVEVKEQESEEEEDEEQQPAREPTPPPTAKDDDKVRRRKPKKI